MFRSAQRPSCICPEPPHNSCQLGVVFLWSWTWSQNVVGGKGCRLRRCAVGMSRDFGVYWSFSSRHFSWQILGYFSFVFLPFLLSSLLPKKKRLLLPDSLLWSSSNFLCQLRESWRLWNRTKVEKLIQLPPCHAEQSWDKIVIPTVLCANLILLCTDCLKMKESLSAVWLTNFSSQVPTVTNIFSKFKAEMQRDHLSAFVLQWVRAQLAHRISEVRAAGALSTFVVFCCGLLRRRRCCGGCGWRLLHGSNWWQVG